MNFFATCPKNLESLLENELLTFGAIKTKQTVAGVEFSGDLAIAYRACLWSRIANRILLPLVKINASNADTLYSGALKINWLEHLHATDTFVVDFAGVSPTIKNSHFGALKIKDAIVDFMRKKTGERPTVEKDNPALRINVYLHRDVATISVDLSGNSLHQRGYRDVTGIAPLKENLAAAILYRANWLEFAKQGKPLLDPMCGSGTLLIEAAMMAADIAPGLLRKSFGFNYWLKHDENLWQTLWQEALTRREKGLANLTAEIRGYDKDSRVIGAARDNIERAGLTKYIDVMVKELANFAPPTHHGNKQGIIVTNPPYGERMAEREYLIDLYTTFGKVLREKFAGWQLAMLAGSSEFSKALALHSHKQYHLFNGSIPCKLLLFNIY